MYDVIARIAAGNVTTHNVIAIENLMKPGGVA
jgi:hypothetical protein